MRHAIVACPYFSNVEAWVSCDWSNNTVAIDVKIDGSVLEEESVLLKYWC